MENEKCKILWDFTIQTDRMIGARRPDITIVNKETRECQLIDIAPGVKLPKIGDGDLSRRPRQKYPIPGKNIEKTTQKWGNYYDDIPKTGEFL